MKMIIEMSLDHYDRFLEKCGASSREWQILKNALIVSHPKDGHYERIIVRRKGVKYAFCCISRHRKGSAGGQP